MRKVVYAAAATFVFVACYWFSIGRYTPYVPFRQDDQQRLVHDPSMWNNEMMHSIQEVLDNYSETYMVKDGKVYISRGLANDTDLVWNYTSKAQRLCAARN